MTCLSVNEVGFNFISIEDRQNHRSIKLIGFTGDFTGCFSTFNS